MVLAAGCGLQVPVAAQPLPASPSHPTSATVPTVKATPGANAKQVPAAVPTEAFPTPAATATGVPIATATPAALPKVPFWAGKGSVKTVPTVSAAQYDAQLAAAANGLLALKSQRPRDIANVLRPLALDQKVRRPDGAVQQVGPDLWNRLGVNPVAGGMPRVKSVTPTERQRILGIVRAQRQALRDWAFPANHRYYKEADVRAIVAKLIADNKIKTGPSWWESHMQVWTKTVGQWFTSFSNWLNGLFPKPSTPTLPNYNFNWLWIAFWTLVVVLLVVLGIALSNSLRGKVGRRIRRSDLTLEGEDAQLLLLPPEELRQRAQDFARQGDFTQALRYRYLSLLLVLDSRGIWSYNPRRTNWEHIAALRKNPDHKPFIAPLSDLTRRFDRVRYGGAWCAPQDWDDFEAACDTLERRFAPLAGGRV